MPGGFTSRQVIAVAMKWGFHQENRAGGHRALWPPGGTSARQGWDGRPFIIREPGRPARDFTAPPLLKGMANAIGITEGDVIATFMAGPIEVRRPTGPVPPHEGPIKLPALAELTGPYVSQYLNEWEKQDMTNPPANPETEYNDPLDLHRSFGESNARFGLTTASDAIYQTVVACNTVNPEAWFSSADIAKTLKKRKITYAEGDEIGTKQVADLLSNMIQRNKKNPDDCWDGLESQIIPSPRGVSGLGHRVVRYMGPLRFALADIQQPDSHRNTGGRRRGLGRAALAAEAAASTALDGETQVVGEPTTHILDGQPVVYQEVAQWEELGESKDGGLLLHRLSDHTVWRAERI